MKLVKEMRGVFGRFGLDRLLNFVRCAHDASIDLRGVSFWHELPPGVILSLKKKGDFGVL